MTTPTAQQFLTAIRSYLGVVESPNGSNRTRVGVEFGWNGVPWCAETISVAAQKAGFARKFWSASTDVWEANARRGVNGAKWVFRSATPRPGDIAVWDWKGDGTANHVSAVETVRSDGKLVTIGGNESNRCQRAVRSKSGLRGYVRMPFRVLSAPSNPTPDQRPTLKRGSTGPYVRLVQAIISKYGGGNIVVNGIFDAKTERRVKDVQRVFKLTQDGVVGPRTWAALLYMSNR